jgi:hypothetical protein
MKSGLKYSFKYFVAAISSYVYPDSGHNALINGLTQKMQCGDKLNIENVVTVTKGRKSSLPSGIYNYSMINDRAYHLACRKVSIVD